MLVDHYGARYAEDLGLGCVSDEGVILEPLSGAALIARVDQVLADRPPKDGSGSQVIGSRSRSREIA